MLALPTWAGVPARAQEPTDTTEGLGLDLVRGVTCLDEPTLRERLRSWLQSWPTDHSLRLEVRGSAHDPRTVVLRLYRRTEFASPELSDAESIIAERRFTPGPARCNDLHDALAIAASLMVKVALQPESLTPAPKAPPEPPPEEAQAPVSPAAEQVPLVSPTPHDAPATRRIVEPRSAPKLSFVPAEKKPTPRGHPYFTGVAMMAFDVGASPGGGGRLSAGLPIGQGFEVRLGAVGLVSRLNDLDPTSGRYRSKLLMGALDLCRLFPTSGALSVRLCAGFLPGLLRLSGFDFAPARDESLFWPAIAAELEVSARITPDWSARFSVAPVFALREAQLVAREEETEVIAGHAEVPRFGALFGIGFAYEVSRQGSTHSEHQGL